MRTLGLSTLGHSGHAAGEAGVVTSCPAGEPAARATPARAQYLFGCVLKLFGL